MKPSDFILNTDYLSLSTATRTSQTVTFAGGTVGALNHNVQTINISAPKVDEAEFQYMISSDGVKWYPTSIFIPDYGSSLIADLIVSRTSANTIQAYLLIGNKTNSSVTYPSKQFWIKEAAIIAPDME